VIRPPGRNFIERRQAGMRAAGEREPTFKQAFFATVRAWTTWARAVAMDETRPSIDMTYEEAEATDELLRALVGKHLTGEARTMA
jgi:predicted Zn-dependent protease